MGLMYGHWLLQIQKRGISSLIVLYPPPVPRDFVDEILSSDTPQPIDSLSLAIRVALQTTLLPRITLEDVPTDHTYEERASLMDMAKGRVPHDQKVFQVDDDWVPPPTTTKLTGQENAVPLIPPKDHWRIPVIITANIVPPPPPNSSNVDYSRSKTTSSSTPYQVKFKSVRIGMPSLQSH